MGSWKDGRVKVNGVYFRITEEVIATVTKIPIEGFKFFRDKKLSTNAVRDFMESEKELKALRKIDTYYVPDSMKKWWRYVLRAIIEYITLDPRFDRARTHHFIILNHFWHSANISFPYYLLTSMRKAVDSFKKKTITNSALHEGLLLLIHEHFKAQTIRIAPPQVENVESSSSSYSSNSEDIQSLSSEEGGISSSGKLATHQAKKLPSPITPSRKIPRDHGQPPKKDGEGDSNDEEESESEEVVKEMQEEIKDESGRKKHKRENLEEVHSQFEEASMLPLSHVHLQAQPEEQKEENAGNAEGEVQVNDRSKARKNFNVRTSKMGIFREAMNPQILVENQDEPRLEELIDLVIVAISDRAREIGMILLNNACNSMIDNFRSIKWIFHELEEVKE